MRIKKSEKDGLMLDLNIEIYDLANQYIRLGLSQDDVIKQCKYFSLKKNKKKWINNAD